MEYLLEPDGIQRNAMTTAESRFAGRCALKPPGREVPIVQHKPHMIHLLTSCSLTHACKGECPKKTKLVGRTPEKGALQSGQESRNMAVLQPQNLGKKKRLPN